jgi:diacylglycerol kinase (ATP)
MLIVEMLNTAIEYVVDRIGLEHNELSGMAKDVASAAVLLSVVLLIFVWIAVLWP